MVDAGFPMDLAAILLGLRTLDASPGDLDLVVLTHYHGDHVGTVAGLRKKYGVRAAMHEMDSHYAVGTVPQETCEAKALTLLFYTALWPLFRYRHFEVDCLLHGGETLDLLGGLQVIHTPGHSVGSICLYDQKNGFLFSGDLIRNEDCILQGPPEHFTTDPEATAVTLRKVAELEFDVLLPGHGRPIIGGAGDFFRTQLEEGRIWPLSEM
jgi:glyoxylase-like metal-dependent hydrolase (beta-lactamase superfamily II)